MVASQLTDPALDRFNTAPRAGLIEDLMTCCATSTWATRIADERPYATRESLLGAAEQGVLDLDDVGVDEALLAHPRIGDRVSGAGTEAQWSRREQSSMSDADDQLRAELREGNVAYEERFGTVFLIRAAGRSPAEMLAELHRRLGNDPATERRELREQLAQISRLRVERLLEP